jgi:hypothetical protein
MPMESSFGSSACSAIEIWRFSLVRKDIRVIAAGRGGAELSLDGVMPLLAEAGFDCVTIDLLGEENWRERLASLPPVREVVLLSTVHPIRGNGHLQRHYGIFKDAPSFSEKISIIRPNRTYLLPHDLSNPFIDYENLPMREATAVLVPDERFWYFSRYTDVHVIGWPKYLSQPATAKPHLHFPATPGVFLPSEVGYYSRRDVATFLSVFKPIADARWAFKLPGWPNVEGLRAALLNAGCPEIPAATATWDIIANYPTVVSNSTSSIITESALYGTDTICVMDESVQSAREQIRMFGAYPNIALVAPQDLAAALVKPERGRRSQNLIRRFDMELLISLLDGTGR